jgi:hypothetical protein
MAFQNSPHEEISPKGFWKCLHQATPLHAVAVSSHNVERHEMGPLPGKLVRVLLGLCRGADAERAALVANWLGREQEKRMMRESKVQIEIPANAAV